MPKGFIRLNIGQMGKYNILNYTKESKLKLIKYQYFNFKISVNQKNQYKYKKLLWAVAKSLFLERF